MMMKFAVVAAIIACVMAQSMEPVPFFAFCNLQAIGTANVTGFGNNIPIKVTRIGDFARYDLYGASEQIAASLVMRPDLHETFFAYMGQCTAAGDCMRLSDYQKIGEEGNLVFYALGKTAMIVVNHEFDLIGEQIMLPMGSLIIQYTSVDYNFDGNLADDFFNVDNGQCPSAKTKVVVTPVCQDVQPPSNFCSVSGVGSATVDGSQESLVAKMKRAGDGIRYDLYEDSQAAEPSASVVIRMDDDEVYTYNSSMQTTCAEQSVFFHLYLAYTINGLDCFVCNYLPGFSMYVDHSTHEIVKEIVPFYNNDIDDHVMVTIEYSSVDYGYVHTALDDAFSIDDDACPDAADYCESCNTSMDCYKTLDPVLPGCAFEMKLSQSPTEFAVYDTFYKSSDFGYMAYAYKQSHAVVRCDIKKGGYCLVSYYSPDDDDCQKTLGFFSDYFFIHSVQYKDEPVEEDCPDNSGDICKLYSTDGFGPVYVNQSGFFIYMGGTRITYNDTIPTLEDFAVTCGNTTVVPAPTVDICLPDSSSSSSSSHVGPSSSHVGPSSSHVNPSSTHSSGAAPSSTLSSASFSLPSVVVALVCVVLVALF